METKKNNLYTYVGLYIVGFIIFFILYWIFVFRPVARIEAIVIKTAQDVETAIQQGEQTARNVDATDKKVDAIIDDIEQILPQLEQVFCNFFPASCPNSGVGGSLPPMSGLKIFN